MGRVLSLAVQEYTCTCASYIPSEDQIYSSYSTDSKDQYNLIGPVPIIKIYVLLMFVETHLFRLVS